MSIQKRHGLFPRIIGKGDNARKLAHLLLRGRKELDAEGGVGSLEMLGRGLMPSATVDSLIIMDRDVDFATVLLTQLTYEGLIEETVGIHQNQAEVDATIVGSAPQTQQTQSVSSNNSSQPSAKQGPKRQATACTLKSATTTLQSLATY